jgi:hypothetical protein
MEFKVCDVTDKLANILQLQVTLISVKVEQVRHHHPLHRFGHAWSVPFYWSLHINVGVLCFVVFMGCMLKVSLQFFYLPFSERDVSTALRILEFYCLK